MNIDFRKMNSADIDDPLEAAKSMRKEEDPLSGRIVNETRDVIVEHDNNVFYVVRECCVWIRETPQPYLKEEDPIFPVKKVEEVEVQIISDEEGEEQPISPQNENISTQKLTPRTIIDSGSARIRPLPEMLEKSQKMFKKVRKKRVRISPVKEVKTNEYDQCERQSIKIEERITEGEISDKARSSMVLDSPTDEKTLSKVPALRVSLRNRIPTSKCCPSCSPTEADSDYSSAELSPSCSQTSGSSNQNVLGILQKAGTRKVKCPPTKVRFCESSLKNSNVNLSNFKECKKYEDSSYSSDDGSSDGSIIIDVVNPSLKGRKSSCWLIKTNKEKKTRYSSPIAYKNKNKFSHSKSSNKVEKIPKNHYRMDMKLNNSSKALQLHNLKEKVRRDELKIFFENLRTKIPSTCSSSKTAKNTILNEAIKYINQLKKDAQYINERLHFHLQRQKKLLKLLNKKIYSDS